MTTNAGAAKIDGNTLFPIFSTEKPLLDTAVHRSVEQGKLEYDKPVTHARYHKNLRIVSDYGTAQKPKFNI